MLNHGKSQCSIMFPHFDQWFSQKNPQVMGLEDWFLREVDRLHDEHSLLWKDPPIFHGKI